MAVCVWPNHDMKPWYKSNKYEFFNYTTFCSSTEQCNYLWTFHLDDNKLLIKYSSILVKTKHEILTVFWFPSVVLFCNIIPFRVQSSFLWCRFRTIWSILFLRKSLKTCVLNSAIVNRSIQLLFRSVIRFLFDRNMNSFWNSLSFFNAIKT